MNSNVSQVTCLCFRADYEPFICTTSCLDPASKRSTKQLMVRLGGHVVSDWRKECELLLMNSLSVTVKVHMKTSRLYYNSSWQPTHPILIGPSSVSFLFPTSQDVLVRSRGQSSDTTCISDTLAMDMIVYLILWSIQICVDSFLMVITLDSPECSVLVPLFFLIYCRTQTVDNLTHRRTTVEPWFTVTPVMWPSPQ